MSKKVDYSKMSAEDLIIKLLRYHCYHTDGGAWLEMRRRLFLLDDIVNSKGETL